MSPNHFNQVDTIKDEFVQEWNNGHNPTLASYLQRFPEYADELTEFIMAFAQVHAVPLVESQPSDQAKEAMLRGLSAGQAKARTVAARLKEIGMSELELTKRLRTPMELLGVFHSNQIQDVPRTFWVRLAQALSLSEIQGRQMLAPRNLAYRTAKGAVPQPKQFAHVIDELQKNGLISPEDYAYWKAESEAE